MEGFVLKRSGEQRDVFCQIHLDGLAKPGVGGCDEVWVVVSRSIHDLIVDVEREEKRKNAEGECD